MVELNLEAAVATLSSMYWAFDIVFAKKAHKTFELLCLLMSVQCGVMPTPLVHVAYKLLKCR